MFMLAPEQTTTIMRKRREKNGHDQDGLAKNGWLGSKRPVWFHAPHCSPILLKTGDERIVTTLNILIRDHLTSS